MASLDAPPMMLAVTERAIPLTQSDAVTATASASTIFKLVLVCNTVNTRLTVSTAVYSIASGFEGENLRFKRGNFRPFESSRVL